MPEQSTGLRSVAGDVLLGYGGQDARCQGRCRGNERSRLDSPAQYGTTPDGEKVIWCPCCNHKLRRANQGESGIGEGTQVQLASMTPDVAARARLFIDDICRYDVISFKEIVAMGDPSATPPERRS